MQNNEPKKDASTKASDLSYMALFRDDYEKNRRWIRAKYHPFLDYLNEAHIAARNKQATGAKFTIVNPQKDFILSNCAMVTIESKIINGTLVNDINKIKSAQELKEIVPVEILDVPIESISINGKDVEFQKISETIVVLKSNLSGNIVINNNPQMSINKEFYIPAAINYNGKRIEVRGNRVTIDHYNNNYCYDLKYNIKFSLTQEGETSNKDEAILQLEDSISNEISVFDFFFTESAVEVFFDNKKEKYRIKKKNKESGRITIEIHDKSKIANQSKVYLATNDSQLSKQKNALMSIMERPSFSQKTLINMCKSARQQRLENFSYTPNAALRYCILTDDNRDGTKTQRDFVQKSLQTPDFMILQGPPGSGKTTAILELIYQLAKKGKKVLLCASTHVAIDNVLEKIINHPDHEKLLSVINPVRVGDEDNVYSECVKPYIYSNIMERILPEFEELTYQSFNLVCGTTLGVLRFPLINKAIENSRSSSIEPIFDYMILDEASKTTFSEFLVPGVLSTRWIIVGDIKQLAPYVEKNDLVPTLLTCKVLNEQSKRQGLTFLKYYKSNNNILYKNNKNRVDNGAFILSPGAIKYIDQHVSKNDSFVAVTKENLENIYTINKNSFKYDKFNLCALSSSATILIEEGMEELALPYLSNEVILLDMNLDVSSDDEKIFKKYGILHHRNSFPKNYKEKLSDYSRKVEDEILWRLIRLYELNEDQGSAKQYMKYFSELMSLLSDEEKEELESTIKTLKNIAIPSIIMMLQVGIDKAGKYDSILEAGFTEKEKENRFVMLEYQHRMHKDISKKSRLFVYNEKALKDSTSWKSQVNYLNDGKSRFEIRDVKGITDMKNFNMAEVDAIIKEVNKFMNYAKDNPKQNKEKYTIAILSFYNGQVYKIREKLQKIFGVTNKFNFKNDEVHISLNTVDKFQGQEADIVYLSMVQTQKDGFLDSVNRVNVALTRAKEKIIVFGDKTYFTTKSKSKFLKFVFEED